MKVILDVKEVRDLKRSFKGAIEAMDRVLASVEILKAKRVSASQRTMEAEVIENKALLVVALMGNLDMTYSLQLPMEENQ
jgi:hypothetical protein